MSAQTQSPARTPVTVTRLDSPAAIKSAWQRAWEARYHAATTGDYAAAERWHDRACALAAQIDTTGEVTLVEPRR